LTVERDTGDNDQVNFPHVHLLSTYGFQDMIGSFADTSLAFIAQETEVITRDDRQIERLFAIPAFDKACGSSLVWQGMIECDPFRQAEKVALFDPGNDLIR